MKILYARLRKKGVLLLVIFLFLFPAKGKAEKSLEYISPETLEEASGKVFTQWEYSWRMQKKKEEKNTEKGFIGAAGKWVRNLIKTIFDIIKNVFQNIKDWLDDLFPEDRQNKRVNRDEDGKGTIPMRFWYILFGGIMAFFLMAVLVYYRRKQKAAILEGSPAVNKELPDLHEESVSADDLTTDRWLSYAKELMEKGDNRLALRALYLGGLKALSDTGFLQLARAKSNREYIKEVFRKGRHFSEGIRLFSDQTRVFDKVWYGMKDVSAQDVEEYAHKQKIMQVSFEG